jgi:hypothetical protein
VTKPARRTVWSGKLSFTLNLEALKKFFMVEDGQ